MKIECSQWVWQPARWPVMLLVCCLLAIANADANASKAAGITIPEHEAIEGPFEDGVDVTMTCLECHEQQARDFMQTTHWTWSSWQQLSDKELVQVGKRHAINNFCVGVASNLDSCTECHAGYGWKDDSFDFNDPTHVDCLVCHDTTGQYKRIAGDGGVADLSVDLELVAKNVGPPSRQTCGMCHFYGGGGHAVKHGDLERTLINADASLDVHMNRQGLNFQCHDCHVTEKHRIPGHSMAASPAGDNPVLCTSCHEGDFHQKPLLNHHARSIACQTCHIPSYAKAEPTKMVWDWSSAEKGKQAQYDDKGIAWYLPYKGDFIWQNKVTPEYAWYSGKAGVYLWGDKINPDQLVHLNWPTGSKSDQDSKIYPFKTHQGKQVYDTVHDYLINPHLSGETGFWEKMDWDTAARIGMRARGLQYSGRYDFVETITYWRINHMVEKADQALTCRDCHGPDQTRMQWKKLGYQSDPLYQAGEARYPLK